MNRSIFILIGGMIMDTKKVKLPNSESVFTVDLALAEILRHPSKAWVIDPVPWIRDKLSPDVLVKIEATKMGHLSELAKIEAKTKEVEAKMYSDMATLLNKK